MRLTVDDWRGNPNLVKIAYDKLNDPHVRMMLDALRNSHLARYMGQGTTEQRAWHLARCEGYQAALNDFEAMGTLTEKTPEMEATFSEHPADVLTQEPA